MYVVVEVEQKEDKCFSYCCCCFVRFCFI